MHALPTPAHAIPRVQAPSACLAAGPEAGLGGAEAGRGFTLSQILGEAGPRMARLGGALDVGVDRPVSEAREATAGSLTSTAQGCPLQAPPVLTSAPPAGEDDAGACPQGSGLPPHPFPLPPRPYQSDRHRGRPGGTQQGVEGRITRGELGAGNPAPWGPGGPDKPPAARLGREEQQHQEAHTQPRTRHPHARGHTTPQTRGHITPPHPVCTSSATWSHTHHTSARSSAHLLAHSLPMHCTPPIPHGSPGALFVQPGSSLAWLPGQSGQDVPLAARKAWGNSACLPHMLPRTSAWPAPWSAEGAQEQARRGVGCGKGPPPRPPPAPWNSLSTAASLIPALPAGWLSPWSGAARGGQAGLGGLSHQAARRPLSPGQGG